MNPPRHVKGIEVLVVGNTSTPVLIKPVNLLLHDWGGQSDTVVGAFASW